MASSSRIIEIENEIKTLFNEKYDLEMECLMETEDLSVIKEVIKELSISFTVFLTLIGVSFVAYITNFDVLLMLLTGVFTTKTVSLSKKYLPLLINKKINMVKSKYATKIFEIETNIYECEDKLIFLNEEKNKYQSYTKNNDVEIDKLRELRKTLIDDEVREEKDKKKLR